MRRIDDLVDIADKNGWVLNPNKKIVGNVLLGLNKANIEKGAYFCPCKIKKIPENECPCKSAKADIEKTGHCYCNLFFKM